MASETGAKVIVVANHKGGSGKTTVAVNLAVALTRAGMFVATMDGDTNQESLTHYLRNRSQWAASRNIVLPMPAHLSLSTLSSSGEADAAVAQWLEQLSAGYDAIVVDTAGHNDPLNRCLHAKADLLITPLNDSFVDLDVLAEFEPETLAVARIGKYAKMVQEIRNARLSSGQPDFDWIVVRTRLSALNTNNKKHVAHVLSDLSRTLGFRCADGLADRLVFREFFPKGLTAADDLSELALGVRPTMSHATAQLEIQSLVRNVFVTGGGRENSGKMQTEAA